MFAVRDITGFCGRVDMSLGDVGELGVISSSFYFFLQREKQRLNVKKKPNIKYVFIWKINTHYTIHI